MLPRGNGPCSTDHPNLPQPNPLKHTAAQPSPTKPNTTQHNTTQHNSTQHNTTQRNTIQPNPTHYRCLASCLTYVLTRFQIQRVLEELDAMGMMDNTLVVFASDNGGCPSGGGSNFPFRGFKHTLFEGGVRTPAFVYSKSDSIIPEEVSSARELLHRVASFFS